MSIHAIVEELNDIEDVSVAAPTDLYILYWNNTNSKWECRAFADWLHAAAHENAGADEISVAGLSGLLADDQHVLDAEVLAVAAALVHAARHENAGADEISIAGLSGLLADDQHVLDAEVIAAVGVSSLTFIIDGGGAEIAVGIHGDLEIPFGCTINQVTLLADQTGSIVIDIWKDSYANFPPTDADSITAAAPPTIAAATKSQDAVLTAWTTAITAGDILRFNVDSVTDIERVTLSLKVTRT